LTVWLPAVAANVDSKKPPTPAIDAGAASGAQGVLPDSIVSNSNAEQSGPSLIAQSDDMYFPASEVDVRATPNTAIDLETDEVRALPPDVIGKIVLKLWIDRSGKVEKASPEASDMSSTITDQAVAAFSNARYRPAIRHGRAVKTISVIEINYANDR
jgi:outer membrane biosynthesis protein TonB